MSRSRLGPDRQPWKGIDANERAYNTVHNALVGIILDGVVGVSPDLGHRQIAPEKADEYLDRGRRVLADFESQNIAPGGSRGRAQFWMENKIRELRRLLSDAEAVRSGAKSQKQTPESYGELRKHLGLASPGKGGGVWGIWDVGRKQWMPDPLKGHIDTSPARYKSKTEAKRKADRDWRALNPGEQFEVRPLSEARRYPKPSPPPRRFVSPRAKEAAGRSGPKQVHRPGKHGTLHLWRITYKDADNPAFGEDALNKWAYDKQAAWDAFNEQVNSEGESWEIVKIEPVLDTGPKKLSFDEAKEGHRVADFNTIDDLIAHAGRELGATHVSYEHDLHGNKLYFPRKDGQYEVANVWQKAGYWHAAGPDSREIVRHLPQGAVPINSSDTWIQRRWSGKRATEARAPSAPHRRTARGAESRGEQYAQDQLQGDYFMEWVREQLAEAARMPPEQVLPLETKQDAMVIARNMLRDLEQDAKRDLQEDAAFWSGFRKELDGSRDWLADELLQIKSEMRGGGMRESPKSEGRWRGYNGYNTISPGIKVWVSGDQPTSVRISGPATQHADVERKVQSWWGAQGLHFRWLSHERADIDLDPLAPKTRTVTREGRRSPKARRSAKRRR